MLLQRWRAEDGVVRWSLDGRWLEAGVDLGGWLGASAEDRERWIRSPGPPVDAGCVPLAPVDEDTEIWASGVTYRRSRDARMEESEHSASIYDRVHVAPRPELFFKATGRRAVGHGTSIRIRGDSEWNVPEPELTLVVDSQGAIAGYTAGNDVSSRSIEGENPLYLPQAKVYDGACALGPGIVLVGADDVGKLADTPIAMAIERDGEEVFQGATSTSEIVRPLQDLVTWLRAELTFDRGVLLMTGTGIVPGDGFSLRSGDRVRIRVGVLELANVVR